MRERDRKNERESEHERKKEGARTRRVKGLFIQE